MRSIKHSIKACSNLRLEEIYLNYPCALNAELYKSLVRECRESIKKISISLMEESSMELKGLLREIRGSKGMKMLKLNFCEVDNEELEMIATMGNLVKLTGLMLGPSLNPESVNKCL